MAIGILLLAFFLFLIGWASYAIANVVHRSLVRSGNPNASIFRAVTAIGSFVVILSVIVLLLYYNVRIER
jgi:SNF family Na+-dependent transporter